MHILTGAFVKCTAYNAVHHCISYIPTCKSFQDFHDQSQDLLYAYIHIYACVGVHIYNGVGCMHEDRTHTHKTHSKMRVCRPMFGTDSQNIHDSCTHTKICTFIHLHLAITHTRTCSLVTLQRKIIKSSCFYTDKSYTLSHSHEQNDTKTEF